MDFKEKTAFILLLDRNDGIITIFAQKYKNIELATKKLQITRIKRMPMLEFGSQGFGFCEHPYPSATKLQNFKLRYL